MPTLDWLNRAEAFTAAGRVPYRLLEQVSAHASTIQPEPVEGPAIHDNLLIQGDNLEALKALMPFYRGHVRDAYASNDDSREKRLIGERWAQTTGERFVMVEKVLNGMDMAAQIRAAIRR